MWLAPALSWKAPGAEEYEALQVTQSVYFVQTFEMRRARLVPTLQEPASTPEQARRRAERTAERRGGAIAIEMMIEEDTGAIDSSRILERFGNVRTTSKRC